MFDTEGSRVLASTQISHKTKGCDIWPPLKSQFEKRFLTGSIMLYSFQLLNVSIIYTNIS